MPLARPDPARRSDALGLAARRAFGGLLDLIDDPEIRDVLILGDGGEDRAAAQLWLDRGQGVLQRVAGWEASAATVRRLATELIASGGRHLDELHPCGDVHLGGGIRVHAALPPIAVAGTAISIRLPRVRIPGFGELAAAGLCDARTAARLRAAVVSKRNLLITGGTATGKTTWRVARP